MHKMGIYSYLYNIYINLSPVNTKTYMKYNKWDKHRGYDDQLRLTVVKNKQKTSFSDCELFSSSVNN